MKRSTIVAVALTGALLLFSMGQGDSEEDPIDTMKTKLDEITAGASPVQDMSTSPGMLSMLKRRESCRLTRYQLNDGGYTWGYGHYSRSPTALPLTITQDVAESLFAQDVAERGEKWVKLYATVDLEQCEFDALVSIAFNMSPQSYKKFATEVNAGNGIDDIAMQSVGWVAPEYQNGIGNRRRAEMAVFNDGEYA